MCRAGDRNECKGTESWKEKEGSKRCEGREPKDEIIERLRLFTERDVETEENKQEGAG